MDSSESHRLILRVFIVYFLVSLFMLGWLLWPFLSIIVLAFVVTGVFSPIYRFLSRKIKPGLASGLTCLFIFVILFVPISFFVGILTQEAFGLYQMGKDAVISEQFKSLLEGNRIVEWANSFLANFNIELSIEHFNRALSELGKFVGLFLYEQTAAIGTNLFKLVVNFFFMLLIIFFLLIDAPRLLNFIVNLSPLPREQDEKLISKFKDMAGAILIGNGLGGLIQGVLGGAVFALFGIKSPFLWGVIMGLLAFLPIAGIGVVMIPAALILFLKGRVAAGLFFIVFYIVVSGGIEYFFKPRLVGQRVRMHTLLVFLAIIGGLKLFGILGIIYGPLVVTAFLTLTDIYESSYQILVDPEKEAPGGTA